MKLSNTSRPANLALILLRDKTLPKLVSFLELSFKFKLIMINKNKSSIKTQEILVRYCLA